MVPAVSGWSPVIITGRMPAASHVCTASRASARGGIHHRDEAEQRHLALRVLDRVPDLPRDREHTKAFAGHACSTSRIRSRSDSVSGTSRSGRNWLVQPASTSSAAPFEYATHAGRRRVQRRHATALRRERDLGDARFRRIEIGRIQARPWSPPRPARPRSGRPPPATGRRG